MGAGTPGPKAIGIDEISIRKAHTYRIVVRDLIRRRPLSFGGQDRSEASMDEVYQFLGQKDPLGCDGHVEGLWDLDPSPRHQESSHCLDSVCLGS
jgi:transposase